MGKKGFELMAVEDLKCRFYVFFPFILVNEIVHVCESNIFPIWAIL